MSALQIRAGRGLGDSLYLLSIVRHFVGLGRRIEVYSDWPDVFREFSAPQVLVAPFSKKPPSLVVAHYTVRKRIAGTDQFQDMCISAGIHDPVPLHLAWKPMNEALLRRLRSVAGTRPLIYVQLPRAPMGRSDGFGQDVLPDCAALQQAIDRIGRRACLVQVGAGEPQYRFRGIEVDLANQTTVTDLLDVASVCAGALGYCSFVIPLFESQAKPLLLVWSRRGLNSKDTFISSITPQKILHSARSRFVMDDDPPARITGAVHELLDQVAAAPSV